MDEEAAPAAVEGTHRSPISAAPTSPFSSPSATSSSVSNVAATEATGECREEDLSDKNVEDVAPPTVKIAWVDNDALVSDQGFVIKLIINTWSKKKTVHSAGFV